MNSRKTSIRNTFSEALRLVMRNPGLFLIDLAALVTGQFYTHINHHDAPLLVLLFLLIFGVSYIFLSYGYRASIPYFLARTQEGTRLTWREIWLVTKSNSKRLILPAILYVVLVICIFFIGLELFLRTHKVQTSHTLLAVITEYLQFYYSYSWLLAIVNIFSFASVYFSVEKRGVTDSLIKSVNISLRNPLVLGIFITISVVEDRVLAFMHNNLSTPSLVIMMINSYITMIFAAVCLVVYQKERS